MPTLTTMTITEEPGHDARTVGDEACVLFDTAITGYAAK